MFPRKDLGETEQFRITGGNIGYPGVCNPSYYAGRHNYVPNVDKAESKVLRPNFICLRCRVWGIENTAEHVCETDSELVEEQK